MINGFSSKWTLIPVIINKGRRQLHISVTSRLLHNSDINGYEILIVGDIFTVCIEGMPFYRSNNQISKKLNISKSTVVRELNDLKSKHYIYTHYEHKAYHHTRKGTKYRVVRRYLMFNVNKVIGDGSKYEFRKNKLVSKPKSNPIKSNQTKPTQTVVHNSVNHSNQVVHNSNHHKASSDGFSSAQRELVRKFADNVSTLLISKHVQRTIDNQLNVKVNSLKPIYFIKALANRTKNDKDMKADLTKLPLIADNLKSIITTDVNNKYYFKLKKLVTGGSIIDHICYLLKLSAKDIKHNETDSDYVNVTENDEKAKEEYDESKTLTWDSLAGEDYNEDDLSGDESQSDSDSSSAKAPSAQSSSVAQDSSNTSHSASSSASSSVASSSSDGNKINKNDKFNKFMRARNNEQSHGVDDEAKNDGIVSSDTPLNTPPSESDDSHFHHVDGNSSVGDGYYVKDYF